MFSVKRVFLGGAAVTAAMLLVVSAAWACSPYGSRTINVDAGPPGTVLRITGTYYEAKYGEVTIQWTPGSDSGILLAKPELKYTHSEKLEDRRTGEMVNHDFSEFTADQVTVPPDKQYGYISVIQHSDQYGTKRADVFTVQASQTAATTTTTQPAPVTTVGTAAPTVTTPGISPTPTKAPAPTPVTQPKADAAAPDVQRPPVPGAPGLTVEGSGAMAIDPGAPLARAVAQTEVGPEVPPWIDPLEPDVQTLWSGLGKSDGSTAASLTGPTEPPDDPSKLGAALLALSALLLLAGGLVAVPRRRALNRIR